MDIVKTLTLPVVFTSEEYADNPDSVTLSFTQAEIDRIEYLVKLARKEDITIRMDIDADELDPMGDWRIGYECLQISYSGSICYYAQSKYDSGVQIETESFTLNTLQENEAQS